ncbi:PP2C family protein-serine/threonine phosphatase [Comamonas humi]
MKFSIFQLSRKGGREKNEDRMGYSYTKESCLFVVADGMGGHPDGEVAAQLALQCVSADFQRLARPKLDNVADFLETALLNAHHHILKHAISHHMADPPRTTLVAAVVQDGMAWWVHCGDSRLYIIRDCKVLTRTRDHSYLELHGGSVSALPERVNRNVLFTCLGAPSRPFFDVVGPVDLQRHDRVMLCSDGLWGSVPEAMIARELGQKPVSRAVPDLVDTALRRAGAGSDNVTIVAMEWDMQGAEQPLAPAAADEAALQAAAPLDSAGGERGG